MKPGDEVYGEIAGGGFAEYVVAKADLLAPKPENLSLEETASLGVAALTALQGLRDWGQLKPGQKVLINGGSGGVGTFAIQLAKTLGASEVAVVCSTRNVKNARSLGADQVIDYTKEDFTELGQKFDVMFDNVGNRPLSACRSMLTKRGRYVMITGPKGRWIAPVPRLVAGILRSIFWSQKVVSKTAVTNLDDLLYLKGLVESGQLKPLVERRLALKDASEALADQGHFHAVGKTLIKVDGAL